MLKVVAKMTIAPEKTEDALVFIRELVSATLEEEGCISYNFCQEAGSESAYAMIETWKDKAALDAHLSSEHFTRISPQLGTCTEGMSLAVYEVQL